MFALRQTVAAAGVHVKAVLVPPQVHGRACLALQRRRVPEYRMLPDLVPPYMLTDEPLVQEYGKEVPPSCACLQGCVCTC